MDSIERKVLVGSLCSLAVLAALALGTYAGSQDLIDRSRELNRIHQVLGKLDKVFKHLGEARISQQAFLRQGRRKDLEACQDALFSIDRLVGEMRTLSDKQEGQLRRIEAFSPLLADQVNRVNAAISQKGHQGLGRSGATMTRLNRMLEDFKASESELMASHSESFEHRSSATRWALLGSLALNLLVFAIVHWLVHREMLGRHLAETALLRQTRLLGNVLRDMNDAVLVYDARGRLNASNPAAERLFGRPAPQLGPDLAGAELLLQEDRQSAVRYVDNPLVQALAGQECFDRVLCVRRPQDRRIFVVSVTARCFFGPDGEVSAAMASYHDITESKNEEQALHGAKRDLEARLKAQKQAQAELQDVAIRDPLTGLFNRRQLDGRMEEELARARHADKHLAVLMCDIDHFKGVNDVYGHDAGDLVLKQVAQCVNSTLRANDSIFRFGGEEFTLLLPGADLQEAALVAEKSRLAVNALRLEHQGRALGPLSISLGIAAFPSTGTEAAQLLRQADEALYASKHGGRNRHTLWSQDLHKEG